jgi:hypothetical protein
VAIPMNKTLEYIHNYPKETKRIIGITYEQLTQLIENAIIKESENLKVIAEKEIRLIKPGGGRKKTLTKTEEIFLTLYYLHHIPTFQLLGINFGVSESTKNCGSLRNLKPRSIWVFIIPEYF